MSITLWLGSEFEHQHEMEALGSFLQAMQDTYGQDAAEYHLLANFIVNNETIDLAIVKQNALIVIELKSVGGPISGGENGPWMVGAPGERKQALHAGRHGNPFLQVRSYRQALIDFLREHGHRFLRPRAGSPPALHHVSALIAMAPNLPAGSEISLPKLRWLRLCGLDQLHLEVYRQRSAALSLTRGEMRSLLQDVLRLRRVPLERWISPSPILKEEAPSASTEAVQPLPPATHPPIAHPGLPGEAGTASPPAVLTPTPSALAVPTPAAVAVSQFRPPLAGTPPPQEATTLPCLACGLQQAPCARPSLKGVILSIEPQPDASYQLLLDCGTSDPELLILSAREKPLVEQIERARARLTARGEDFIFHLLAFHLDPAGEGWKTNPASLLVLEPDWLINVTSLTDVEFCQRQVLLARFQPFTPGEQSVRGNIVHQLLPAIWELHPRPVLNQALEQALGTQVATLAAIGLDPDVVREAVKPHVDHLLAWAGNQRGRQSEFRSETFVLAPLVGIKGRIDALWERDARPLVLGELKTGRSQGRDPKPGHALQVATYALALFASGELAIDEAFALLLYSGNDALGGDGRNVMRRVPLDFAVLQRCLAIRNELVLLEYTGEARFELNPNKCRRCSAALNCARAAVLSEHDDPRQLNARQQLLDSQESYTPAQVHFFKHYASLLTDELRAAKNAHAALWAQTPEQRAAEGLAMPVESIDEIAAGENRRRWYFRAAGGSNTTELRSNDAVLISGPGGPAATRVALGTIIDSDRQGVILETSDELRFQPLWLDKYSSESMVESYFAGLFQFVVQPGRLRELVIENRLPKFSAAPPAPIVPTRFGDPARLNPLQQEALQAALRAEDYLLIQGPPGSGKTLLIEHIVRAHLALGQRVLIAAGTNRAVDEVLQRLVRTEFADQVLRLGNPHSVADAIRPHTLEALSAQHPELEDKISALRTAFANRSVVGATAHSLLSGNLTDILGTFDLVIIDEASQMTVPAALGALRWGNRFILIGDHKQLPAVVISELRGRAGAVAEFEPDQPPLSISLFERLLEPAEAAGALIRLEDQYRMNAAICRVPSQLWYDERLRPASDAVARKQLGLPLVGDFGGGLAAQILSAERPIILIDVPPDPNALPRTNGLEAAWAAWLVAEYARLGLALPQGDQPGSMGVIAPFRAQVAAIRHALEMHFLGREGEVRSLVDTVDRFQGSERELIIVSLATGSEALHELLRDERRLNVALSRAKHKLILLGNRRVLAADPTYYNLLQTIDEVVDYADWIVPGAHLPERRR